MLPTTGVVVTDVEGVDVSVLVSEVVMVVVPEEVGVVETDDVTDDVAELV